MSASDRITLRYWASAASAAGVDADEISVDGPVTVGDLRRRARELHDNVKFRDVIGCCSVLVGDRPAHDDSIPVSPGASVEFLPPFAGG